MTLWPTIKNILIFLVSDNSSFVGVIKDIWTSNMVLIIKNITAFAKSEETTRDSHWKIKLIIFPKLPAPCQANNPFPFLGTRFEPFQGVPKPFPSDQWQRKVHPGKGVLA